MGQSGRERGGAGGIKGRGGIKGEGSEAKAE